MVQEMDFIHESMENKTTLPRKLDYWIGLHKDGPLINGKGGLIVNLHRWDGGIWVPHFSCTIQIGVPYFSIH